MTQEANSMPREEAEGIAPQQVTPFEDRVAAEAREHSASLFQPSGAVDTEAVKSLTLRLLATFQADEDAVRNGPASGIRAVDRKGRERRVSLKDVRSVVEETLQAIKREKKKDPESSPSRDTKTAVRRSGFRSRRAATWVAAEGANDGFSSFSHHVTTHMALKRARVDLSME